MTDLEKVVVCSECSKPFRQLEGTYGLRCPNCGQGQQAKSKWQRTAEAWEQCYLDAAHSRRDQFAAAALTGLLAAKEYTVDQAGFVLPGTVTEEAFRIADAMVDLRGDGE